MAGPVMRFRSGSISATVWENQKKDGTVFPMVRLTKSIRDKQSQEWRETECFDVNDLPVVAILARKAFEALALDHAASGHPVTSEEPDEAEDKPARRRKADAKGGKS